MVCTRQAQVRLGMAQVLMGNHNVALAGTAHTCSSHHERMSRVVVVAVSSTNCIRRYRIEAFCSVGGFVEKLLLSRVCCMYVQIIFETQHHSNAFMLFMCDAEFLCSFVGVICRGDRRRSR